MSDGPVLSGDSGANGSEIAASETTDADAASMPTDATGWRSLVATLPVKEVLRVVQQDKDRVNRLLAGFRPGGAAIRHPVVLGRIADEAVKQKAFADALVEVEHAWATQAEAATADAQELPLAPPPPAETTLPPASDDSALRDTLKKQRASLREQETRIAQLENEAATTRKERDTARTEAVNAQAALQTARVEAERQKRRNERDTRRVQAAEQPPSVVEVPSTPAPTLTAPAPTVPPRPQPLEQAARRLLSRGKYPLVAELCREALLTDAAGENSGARGIVHALYATALYGIGSLQAEEQDRLAVAALLDGGDVPGAAESLSRFLMQGTVRQTDAALLRRLVTLAERANELPTVRNTFARLRIAAPEGFRKLQQMQAGGGRKNPDLLGLLTPTPSGTGLGQDEAVALPTSYSPAAMTTPRRTAQAVEAGDTALVRAARTALQLLRERGGTEAFLADAFLEAVALSGAALVAPLLTPPNGPVLVDASNVARYEPDPLALAPPPRVKYLLLMRDFLLQRGFFPVLLIADANLRFHMSDKAAYLDLVNRHIVQETLPNTSADELLLREARDRSAPLVTNDRFSEWGQAAQGIDRLAFTVTPRGVTLTPA